MKYGRDGEIKTMWPWKKKKEVDIGNETPMVHVVGNPILPEISIDDIGDAIITLRGDGFHFAISYSQMGGYDAALMNPDRFLEIIEIIEEEPNFTEEGIDFAVKHQISEISSIISHKGAYLSGPNESKDYRIKKENAYKLLALVAEIGRGDLEKGLCEVGFNFREFLVKTVVERRQEDIDKVINLANEKKTVLRPLFIRSLASGRDRYGDIQYDKVAKEVNDFIDNFFPEGSFKFFFICKPFRSMFRLACSWAEEGVREPEYPLTGIDFEHWCSAELEKQGWSVTISKASGDQGVDIIAMHEDLTAAIQCKLYSSPIGNKAVQEAYTGMKHYCADIAVVIGKGGFTRSAIELANTTDVLLLDAEAIGDFTQQVFSRV